MRATKSANLGRILALARRDFAVERSYRFQLVTSFAQLVVMMLITFQVSTLIVDSPELEPYGGDYFDFVIVGLAIMSIANVGIRTFTEIIRREQSIGTFEVLLATPTALPVLLTGSLMFPLALTLAELVLFFGVGLALVGGGLEVVGLLVATPIIALLLLSFCAFGILGASIVIVVKRGDPLAAPLSMATSILSGAIFPVSTLPAPFEVLARAFPAFYGINGTREALLAGGGFGSVFDEIAALATFNAVLLPGSLWVFGRALRSARRIGTLANY